MSTTMTRGQVYKLVDGERRYQEGFWTELDRVNNPGDFLIYIERYLNEAKRVNNPVRPDETMSNVRKIAGLAVAAMELFGAPSRDSEPVVRKRED